MLEYLSATPLHTSNGLYYMVTRLRLKCLTNNAVLIICKTYLVKKVKICESARWLTSCSPSSTHSGVLSSPFNHSHCRNHWWPWDRCGGGGSTGDACYSIPLTIRPFLDLELWWTLRVTVSG